MSSVGLGFGDEETGSDSGKKDEEDDYMSDSFLLKLQEEDDKKKNQRQLVGRKRKGRKTGPAKPKSIKLVEKEKREKALETAIDSSNKGFKMLEAMGYRPGEGLGKRGSGLVVPLAVEFKSDRTGLGLVDAKQEAEEERRLKRVKIDAGLESSFRDRMMGRYAKKHTRQLIRQGVLACQNLDAQHSVALEDNKYLIPFFGTQTQTDCGQIFVCPFVAPSPGHSLSSPSLGHSSTSSLSSPPGSPSAVAFSNVDEAAPRDIGVTKVVMMDLDHLDGLEDKWERLIQHMRDTYLYCVFCGASYPSDEQMAKECPGTTEDDH